MSSYLTIYGRLKSSKYEISRKNREDYELPENDGIISIATFCRSSELYQVFNEIIHPAYTGNGEKYTVLTKDGINSVIQEIEERINNLKSHQEKRAKEKEEYLQYLAKSGQILTFSEFQEHMNDFDEEVEDIEFLNYALGYAEFISSLVDDVDYSCSSFSEILCNVD